MATNQTYRFGRTKYQTSKQHTMDSTAGIQEVLSESQIGIPNRNP